MDVPNRHGGPTDLFRGWARARREGGALAGKVGEEHVADALGLVVVSPSTFRYRGRGSHDMTGPLHRLARTWTGGPVFFLSALAASSLSLTRVYALPAEKKSGPGDRAPPALEEGPPSSSVIPSNRARPGRPFRCFVTRPPPSRAVGGPFRDPFPCGCRGTRLNGRSLPRSV